MGLGVEAAVCDLVDELGALSAQRAVVAANALRIAALLDEETDGSKAASLSRQLDRLLLLLSVPASALPAVPDAPQVDHVARIQDEVARKRQQRSQTG
jgi:hypothetical protein